MGLSSGRLLARRITFLGLCLAVALSVTVPSTPWQATAQAEEKAGDAATTPPADPGAAAQPEKRNLFWHIVISAGPVFGPLLLFVSVGLVALIVLLTLDLRMGVAIPPGFVEEFTDTINKRKFKEAFDLARNDNSFVSRVITAGMGRLQYGIEDAREATFGMIETIKASKEQLITYLSTIGTLGPMLGLVGTVFGMIIAFMALGVKGQTPNTAELAGGISHALVITLLGVALSVPAIFFHAFFRNRLIRISMDVSNVADDLLTQMYHNSKKPAPPGAPNVPGAPVPMQQNVQPVAR